MGSNKAITEEQWTTYLLARKDGFAIAPAAAKAGFSRSVAMRMRGGAQSPEYRRALAIHKELHPKDVVESGDVETDAARALTDFAYFRLRYFGRYSTPWQVDAAEQIVKLLESDDKEYVVVNVPPGAGKSTAFTHDIPVWLICRNRAIRIMIGSATERTARAYGGRIRRTLERAEPLKNDSAEVEAGLVADAEAALIEDFGRFKPANRDLWRSEEFVVEQPGGVKSDEKEATVATYGRDGGFLGGRFDFVIWDDLVTSKVLRTAEARENLIDWWDGEAESRLEPGGVMVLQGQRLHADDLYRHCLDKTEPILDGDDEPTEGAAPRQYRHIIYKAHHTEVCRDQHTSKAPAYDPRKPDTSGCLLDPRRLSWRELQRRQANNLERFLVLYQQEDVDPAAVLVNRLWVAGGRDPETGEDYPGCWDHERSTGIIPKGLSQPNLLVVTVDPSPSKFWAVEAWLYHHETKARLLIDLYRGTLTVEQFLSFNPNSRTYSGLLEDWWQAYKRQGQPYKHLVVEENAAQRFLLQIPYVKEWASMRGVAIIPHQTHGNKNDPDFGVLSTAPHWKFGRVRLPGNRADGSRGRSMALVDEATRWPESRTEDCVMAYWFMEVTLAKRLLAQLIRPASPPQRRMPSWLSGR